MQVHMVERHVKTQDAYILFQPDQSFPELLKAVSLSKRPVFCLTGQLFQQQPILRQFKFIKQKYENICSLQNNFKMNCGAD